MPIKDPEKRRQHHTEYMRNVWYPANKSKQMAANDARRKKLFAEVGEYKVSVGCKDCGYNKHQVALDFDHLGNKLFEIARGINNGYSRKRIEAEMKKCDVVCSNCHRIRTAKRGRTKQA